ncbi:sodium/proton antiporter, CPA1 family (TC 2.A.36) [Natronincola peptidivorans]|uniref:Sodium/proton antiporter, CPA1 family (TC 2.A.36) n=1 Tax=Natronincola peptidivorans TaxID=426128 RepID=A0A1I0DXW2_9FIRM|nr:cation:proton antiporter [Natronincola peptidivorans]SET37084.1 sodium/proton antiporter, CPA1 family (TC 2.A.36) [Natronincola peptidivorans]
MALSLALIILLGLLFNKTFDRLYLPGLLGMLTLGILIGPHSLNLIDEDLLAISSELRKIALIIILLRAGLSLNKQDLKKVGGPAIKMSFFPVLLEGFVITAVASLILDMSMLQAAILGFIIAAVSPAVIVPEMLDLKEKKLGEKKGIPTLILAAASVDDVFAITLFTTFLGLYGGGDIYLARQLFNIPVSILLGIVLGAAIGMLLIYIFKKYPMRDTEKVLVLLGAAIILAGTEDLLQEIVPIAALLGVMMTGFILLEKYPKIANRIGSKFNKIWVFAQLLLFVLVGAEVNVSTAIASGLVGLIIIIAGLLARSIGVLIALQGTSLNRKEKLFCILSFLPKATVQAAIGAIPMSLGIPNGESMLAIAVLAIIITAPLGSLGIKITRERWLTVDDIQ